VGILVLARLMMATVEPEEVEGHFASWKKENSEVTVRRCSSDIRRPGSF